jgi:hypothetical protein
MKETAVEFLVDNLHYLHSTKWDDILEQAKEMEKQQICEAYAIGGSPLLGPWEFGEEYYDETFEKKPK